MDSSAKILAKRYAGAYMNLDGKAFSAAAQTASLAKLEGLRVVFTAVKPHLKVLTHPAINSVVKLEVLGKILGAGVTGPAVDFAGLLVRQGRFGLFEEVMRQCLALNDIFCGVVQAEVSSRYALSEGEVARIDKLIVCLTGKKVSLNQKISERTIGGFEIKVGDALIDATVHGRLDALRAGLLKG